MAKTESKNDPVRTNGRTWKKVERTRAKFWRPDDDSDSLVAKLIERVAPVEGARVQRHRWLAEVLEDCQDARGELKAGEKVSIGESVVLADLMAKCKTGDVVRITPAGLDGRVKVYELEMADG